jgi:hypothetical protein
MKERRQVRENGITDRIDGYRDGKWAGGDDEEGGVICGDRGVEGPEREVKSGRRLPCQLDHKKGCGGTHGSGPGKSDRPVCIALFGSEQHRQLWLT